MINILLRDINYTNYSLKCFKFWLKENRIREERNPLKGSDFFQKFFLEGKKYVFHSREKKQQHFLYIQRKQF